ncbi:MAG: histidine kinase [Eubacteriales bacterium]|nr:histidine kinase [Eubacteriales bacterium]
MKLSVKMTILFSVVMVIAILRFSSYTIDTTINGSNIHTEARFENMSASIARDLESEILMMTLTLNELTDNTSFMAALNQFVRDDSPDHKMGNAARLAALQQLHQSPLVESFYRVSFVSSDGLYLTSLVDKDSEPFAASEELKSLCESLSQTEPMDAAFQYYMLAPRQDDFAPREDILVYGIIQRIHYQGNVLGYLCVLNEYRSLDHIMNFVDNSNEVEVQAVFDDGSVLFSSTGLVRSFPADLSVGDMQVWEDAEHGTTMEVLHTRLDSLGLSLYISRDSQVTSTAIGFIRFESLRQALFLMLPAIVLIALISFGLTRSTRRLTKKVRQMPEENVLLGDASAAQALMEMVTSPRDHEIYTLEETYNSVMLRLRDSTLKELALREGTLQAQLSALQAQINPHFIYNTLNIISAKSMESENFDVIEICDQFASMLRYSTDTRSRTAAMRDEIEHVRNYLMLAKARYEENLEFTIDVPEDLLNIEVPKLTLQPLVENALNHGYDGKHMLRVLSVTGKAEDGKLFLEVRDNGTGFEEEVLKKLRERIREIEANRVSIQEAGEHIGLVNTCLRLHYYSKGAIHVEVRNDGGAVITMVIPAEGR